MSTGCRITLQLNVSVHEMLDIQKTWEAFGVGSLEQFALLLLLRGKVAELKSSKEDAK